jgi:hypothetical protein
MKENPQPPQKAEEKRQELLSSYQQMAQDESREAEALEWAEALISDVSSEEE